MFDMSRCPNTNGMVFSTPSFVKDSEEALSQAEKLKQELEELRSQMDVLKSFIEKLSPPVVSEE